MASCSADTPRDEETKKLLDLKASARSKIRTFKLALDETAQHAATFVPPTENNPKGGWPLAISPVYSRLQAYVTPDMNITLNILTHMLLNVWTRDLGLDVDISGLLMMYMPGMCQLADQDSTQVCDNQHMRSFVDRQRRRVRR